MNALELADKLEKKALTADAMEYGFEVVFEEATTMLRQQQAEIEALKKFKAESDALDKKLFESIQKSNEMWDKATKLLLKKAQEK